ncbi:MAG: DUF4173 domain-containing protein, partial [Clostridiales Family XIII bacterium]|nr:DUF4173 domain-containing protein [Clostridiales Family XIII bacterium]
AQPRPGGAPGFAPGGSGNPNFARPPGPHPISAGRTEAGYAPRVAPQPGTGKPSYRFGNGDGLLAILLIFAGFLFCEWIGKELFSLAIGCFLFAVIAIAVTLIYFRQTGIRQNATSRIALAVVMLGALPFLLYDTLPITALLFLFECAAYPVWVMYSCGTSVSKRLNGFILCDLINQFFVTPFHNFFAIFASLRWSFREGKGNRTFIAVLIGILISVPLLFIVIALLVSAESAFSQFMERAVNMLHLDRIGLYGIELILGIPVACYLFGSVHGNAAKRTAGCLTEAGARENLLRVRKIPRPAIYGSLTAFIVVYVCFFISMGAYLFSAFSGDLPSMFSYAGYARRGFFELCVVAGINLVILVFVHAFAKRSSHERPRPLRILTACMAALTILLVVTAGSKMLLYISAFGLTRLRVYTLWFMTLLLVVFIVLFLRHLKIFNAGKSIVMSVVVLVLALFLSNSDALIANYNIAQYENGQLEELDLEMLTYMSDAVLPALYELRRNSEDETLRGMADKAIEDHIFYFDHNGYRSMNFANQSLQSFGARALTKDIQKRIIGEE